MKSYRTVLIVLVLVTATLCSAQEATRDTTGDAAFFDAVHQLDYILQGVPLQQVEKYIPKEGMVIVSDSTMRLRDLLSRSNRMAIFGEDLTRQGASIQARSDKSYSGAYVVIMTVDAKKGNPHYHSFTLFKEPDHGWQIFLWHVGG